MDESESSELGVEEDISITESGLECLEERLECELSSSPTPSIDWSLSEDPSIATVSRALLLTEFARLRSFAVFQPAGRLFIGAVVPRFLGGFVDAFVVDLVFSETEPFGNLLISDTAFCLDKELDMISFCI